MCLLKAEGSSSVPAKNCGSLSAQLKLLYKQHRTKKPEKKQSGVKSERGKPGVGCIKL